MKITVQINSKDVEIELTKEQVASIKSQNKLRNFEFNYPNNQAFLVGYKISHDSNPDSDFIECGKYRLTKEAAEMSLARNKRTNRLEALAEQLGGLREWVENTNNYYIYYYGYAKEYQASFNNMSTYSPERVYMTEKCAIEICRMLNDGEFEL